MATADVIQEQEEQEQEHLGGGRFNRLLGVVFVVVAMVGGVALALGVQSSGSSQISASQKSVDDPGSAARDRGRNRGPCSSWRTASRGTDGHADTGPADLPGAGSAQRAQGSQPVCAMG
jgi:hypothetical protein